MNKSIAIFHSQNCLEKIGNGGSNLENFRKQICDVQALIDKLISKRNLGY